MITLLLAISANAETMIGDCNTISSPGEYILRHDILNSPAVSCIKITSSDVVFDGAGYTIGGIKANLSIGLYVAAEPHPSAILTNVTVKNLKVNGWFYGIVYEKVQNGRISNNTASNNLLGIALRGSSNNIVTNNNASNNNNGYGIWLEGSLMEGSSNNTLVGNTASNNNIGILFSSTNNNILTGNTASNNNIGISISSINNNIDNNTVYNNIFYNNNNNSYIYNSINNWNTAKTAGTNIIGGSYLGGNIWANANGTGFSQTCTDSDNDGICDSSYTLDTIKAYDANLKKTLYNIKNGTVTVISNPDKIGNMNNNDSMPLAYKPVNMPIPTPANTPASTPTSAPSSTPIISLTFTPTPTLTQTQQESKASWLESGINSIIGWFKSIF